MKRLGLVIVEGKSYFQAVEPEVKVAVFDESAHPRDRHGKFIEIGGTVSIWGGGTGKVTRAIGDHRVEVERADGKKVIYDTGHVTVARDTKPVYSGDAGGRATRREEAPVATINFQTASPPEIDEFLQGHGIEEAKARGRAQSLHDSIAKAATARQRWNQLSEDQVARMTAEIAELEALAAKHRAAQRPGEQEFRERGGWTRGFLVTNPGGHLHKTTACSTCYPTTQFAWLTYLSGMDEDQIVEEAGERACTVCYPTAPVNVLQRASRLRPDVEARAELEKIRAEKAERNAEKDKKAIFDPDGGPLKADGDEIRTEIAARRKLSELAFNMLWYSPANGDRGFHPSHDKWQLAFDQVVAAIVAKTGEDEAALRADVDKKAHAKLRKEQRAGEAFAAQHGWN